MTLRHFCLYLTLISIGSWLSSCTTSNIFSDPLLYSQNFRGNRKITTENLEPLLPQKPNKKILRTPITPGLYFYQLFSKDFPKKKLQWEYELTKLNEDFEEQIKGLDINSNEYNKLLQKKEKKAQKLTRAIAEGNWAMRTFGEPPSYFYKDESEKNVEKIKTYYKNHGFFLAQVSYKVDSLFIKKGSVAVTYVINEGVSYPIGSNDSLVVKDYKILQLLEKNKKQSFLKSGERLTLENYNAEKDRIESLLKNNGYYAFSKDFLSLKINALDTAKTGKLQVITYIPSPDRNPRSNNYSTAYNIGNIQFIADGTYTNAYRTTVDTVYSPNIQYIFVNKKFSPSVLDTKIDLRKNQVFSQEKINQTQKKLYGLEQFQFTRINLDTIKGVINASIYAKPLDKYEFSVETGGSVFAGGSLNNLVPGPFLNTSFKARNINNSVNSFETTFRFGFEAQAGFLRPDSVNRNLELGLNTSFIIPKILLPEGLAQRFENYSPQTRISVGGEFIGRQEYNRFGFKVASTFNWRPSPNKYWQVSLFDVNLVNTSNQAPAFRNFLDSLLRLGNNLKRSFQQSFISSMSATYTYTDNPYGQLKQGKYLKLFFESGGTTLNLVKGNKFGFLTNLLQDSLQFYRFIKASADYRKYIPIGRTDKTLLAYRINTGAAFAYGADKDLPYEKNFFIGGPNSLRAWRPRGLGPGSFTGSFDNPGSIILETSAELRFKIIRFYGDLNGALFADAGNVWRFPNQNTAGLTGSDFQLNRFYKEIAMDIGFGLRYDLSFFVIRFDWAVRVLDPAFKGDNWVFLRDNLKSPLYPEQPYTNPLTLNFGIGYPF